MQKRFARYDKAGEEHFNLLSAYHKSLRGSDPQGALYWMARMIDGGEDPMTLFRRAIAMAAEDIGLADPNALDDGGGGAGRVSHAGPARGLSAAGRDDDLPGHGAQVEQRQGGAGRGHGRGAQDTPAAPVPLHIRNAPTPLMKELGYGRGYRTRTIRPDAYLPQEYLPDELRDALFYVPGTFGYEKTVAERMELVGPAQATGGVRARTRPADTSV